MSLTPGSLPRDRQPFAPIDDPAVISWERSHPSPPRGRGGHPRARVDYRDASGKGLLGGDSCYAAGMSRTHFPIALILLIAGCSAPPPADNVLVGKVVSVADGDTLTILVDKTQHRIRLHGIDCPDAGQPFRTRAKQFAAGKAFGKRVSVTVLDTDGYGRLVGNVFLPDGTNLGHLLVEAGLAWWYQQYAPADTSLATIEAKARKSRVGVWSDSKPIPPWEWRNARDDGSQVAYAGYWLNEASGVRHNSECEWYRKTKRGRECEATEGRACGTCGG